MESTAIPQPRAGRPRDAHVDEKILRAAIIEYGRVGWAGFTMDAIAKAAGVSKASMYLRWQDKGDLLEAALARYSRRLQDLDTGSIRGDLIELARFMYEQRTGIAGPASRRIELETRLHPVIADRLDDYISSQVHASREAVRRAVRRGELDPSTPVSLLLESLLGAVVIHLSAAPDRMSAELPDRDDWIERLVDFMLASVGKHDNEYRTSTTEPAPYDQADRRLS